MGEVQKVMISVRLSFHHKQPELFDKMTSRRLENVLFCRVRPTDARLTKSSLGVHENGSLVRPGKSKIDSDSEEISELVIFRSL